jgi:hypothetical protein
VKPSAECSVDENWQDFGLYKLSLGIIVLCEPESSEGDSLGNSAGLDTQRQVIHFTEILS